MKRLRKIFESIVYAGIKPGASASPAKGLRWLGPLRGPVERLLNGNPSADPFYLTNRSVGQRVRLGILISIPFLVVLTAVAMAALGYFDDPSLLPPPDKQMSSSEVAAKMLPDLNQDIDLTANKDLEIVDVQLHHGGGDSISGTVRNSSGHTITSADVIFDLTNSAGSRVGAVDCKIGRVEAGNRATFETAIEQKDALFAIVREVHDR